MNKPLILCALAALAAFGQSQTPLTITQSAGSATGELRMQERRTNGQNYVGIKAPQSVAANTVWALPTADGTSNQCLSTDGAGQWGWSTCSGASVDLLTTDYDWSQTPGGSLTAATPATVTLTPCPDGVAPYSTHYNVRISGGTGTAETVLITAVSGSGSTCDVTFTPANNHSGAWTIASASDGIHEAARMVTGAKRLFIPLGTQTMDEPAPGEETTVYIQQGLTVAGAGNDPGTGSYVYVTGDQWAIIFDTIFPVHVSNLAIGGTGSMASGGGIKLTAPVPSGPTTYQNCNSIFRDLQLSQLRTGMHLERGCLPWVNNNMFSAYSYEGLRLENYDNPDGGDQTITGNYFQVVGAGGIGTTAIKWLSAGGARIASNKFNTQGGAIDLESNTNTGIASIIGNSFDNQTEFSVKVRAPSPDSFAFINISSNIFTGAGASGYEAIDIGDTTDDIDNVAIVGNNMQGSGTAIRIGSADKVTIDGNTIGLYATGIKTTSAATQVNLGQNTLYNLTTKYDIANDANIRPNAPLFVSGYSRSWSSGSNIQAIAEFAESSVGTTANNAVMFLNGSTGSDTQRGIWWGYNTGDLNFARFGTAKTAAPSTDLTLQTDGDAQFNYKVGIGRSPSTGVALDVNGTIRSTDGTIILQSYVFGGAGYLGTETNHPLLVLQNNSIKLRLNANTLLPETDAYLYLGDRTKQFNTVFATGFESIQSSAGFVSTRKLEVHGDATGTLFDYFSKPTSTSIDLRNTAGNLVMRWDSTGITYNGVSTMYQLWPGGTTETLDLGVDLARWKKFWVKDIDGTGTWQTTGSLSAAAATFTGLTINTGAATVGHVWTATSTGGAGSWQAIPTALPVVDTTGIAKGSSDATKIVRLEVDGLTTGTTRALTVQDGNYTIAGLNINQTFVNPQTIAIASVQNQLTLSQTIATGAYDPACLVLASTDTVTTTVYGAGRLCGGYESALFTDEKVAIQTATGSGTYQDVVTFKNQTATFSDTVTATTINYGGGTMTGTMKPLFGSTGSIGASGYSYATGFFNSLTVTNNGPALGAGQNIAPLWVTGTSGFVSFGLYRTDDTNGGWLFGTSGLAVGDFAIYQNQGAGSPARRLSIGPSGAVDVPGALTTTGLTINTGAATVGYVWTATSTGGAGSWQAASGGSSLPVVDTTGIAKGSSDATKIARLEVDGLTTGTTRALTVQDGNYTIAGLNINQTFVNPQTIAIASVQNQMTLSQTNNSGFYDPACLVLAATDTVGSTVYGAGRLCGGYESASFTNEKVAIQTATGSGTYQDVVTFKNQTATFSDTVIATTINYGGGTMAGTMKPLFGGTGSIGDSGYSYGAGYFSASGFILTDTTTVGYVWTATSTGGAGSWQAAAACPTCYVQSGNSFGTAAILGTSDNFPVYFKTNNVVRWDISAGGNLVPDSNNAYTFGHPSFRPSTIYAIDLNASGTVTLGGSITGDVLPTTTGAYVSGSNTYRWGKVSTFNVDIDGDIALSSGTSLSGTLVPTTNNFYALGNTSFRWSTVATTNVNISGTITTPSGSAGITSTKTVRDSAGTGTCTLIFSGGILTGGTC